MRLASASLMPDYNIASAAVYWWMHGCAGGCGTGNAQLRSASWLLCRLVGLDADSRCNGDGHAHRLGYAVRIPRSDEFVHCLARSSSFCCCSFTGRKRQRSQLSAEVERRSCLARVASLDEPYRGPRDCRHATMLKYGDRVFQFSSAEAPRKTGRLRFRMASFSSEQRWLCLLLLRSQHPARERLDPSSEAQSSEFVSRRHLSWFFRLAAPLPIRRQRVCRHPSLPQLPSIWPLSWSSQRCRSSSSC